MSTSTPQVPASTTDLTGAASVAMPVKSESLIAAPPFIPSFAAFAEGAGFGWAGASPVTAARAAGVGAIIARLGIVAHAAASGSGTVSVLAKSFAWATGDGATTAGVRELTAVLAAAGSGTAAAPASPTQKAASAGAGQSSATASPRASAYAVGAGTVTASASSFSGMGIDKVGAQTLALSTWETVTGWTARSGYPYTVISGNGILVPAGTVVNIAAHTYRGSAHAGNQTRILANGTVIATGSGGAREAPVSLTGYSNVADAVITLQAIATSSLTDRNVIAAGVNTFLTVDPA